MLSSTVVHEDYVVTLLQEVVGCELRPQSLPQAWWNEPVGKTLQGIPVFGIPKGGTVKCVVFINGHPNHDDVLKFLEEQAKADPSGLTVGGLALVDIEAASLLQTNWDLGETEEWEEIVESVVGGEKVTHTFSATDLAIDVSTAGDAIRLQLLDWEAMPNRLETSRLNEPVHIYRGRRKFLSGVAECLRCLHQLREQSQRPVSKQLVELLSVRARLG